MASSKGSEATFTGGSGQMAVMAELLHRKCNAAIPHVDVGTDLFAFRDEREDVARIQVKTARARPYKRAQGYSAKFGLPMRQLERIDNPRLFSALAIRLGDGWADFIVISRAELKGLWDQGCGYENIMSGDLELHLQVRRDEEAAATAAGSSHTISSAGFRIRCGQFDLSGHVNAWEILPPLKSLPAIDAEPPQV